jgi:ADP-ribose pyrophosphatase
MPEPSASRRVFDGRHVRVDEEDWPGVGTWEVVRPLDAVCVLPLMPDGRALLVRQFRPAVRAQVLEAPAGLLDVEGEALEACAARELFEETGYRAVSLEGLGGVHASVGHSSEYVHLFLATTGEAPEAEPEHGLELVERPFADVAADARAGRLVDVKTALIVLLADARTPAG